MLLVFETLNQQIKTWSNFFLYKDMRDENIIWLRKNARNLSLVANQIIYIILPNQLLSHFIKATTYTAY